MTLARKIWDGLLKFGSSAITRVIVGLPLWAAHLATVARLVLSSVPSPVPVAVTERTPAAQRGDLRSRRAGDPAARRSAAYFPGQDDTKAVTA